MPGEILKRVGSTLKKTFMGGGAKDRESETFLPHGYVPSSSFAKPSGFKAGGVVRKSGLAMVHKGERIIPKRMRKASSRKRY